MSTKPPVIALALDAAEGSLVNRLVAEGRMPHLAALREHGVYGDVHNRPDGFLSMVWPTFITGQTLGAHGWYFNKLWSADDQCLRYVDPSWLPIRPFWQDLGPDVRAALLDVPFAPPPEEDFNGVFLNGWQAHDDFGEYSVPADLLPGLRTRHGRPAMKPEVFGPQDTATLERQRHEAIASLKQFSEVVLDVLDRERWDLSLAVFGGAHRGGHYLWSLDEADVSAAGPDARRRLEATREELYVTADRALGEVVAALPAEARLMVFSLHGMGRNRGWAEHFGAVVNHLHARGRPKAAPKQGLVYRIKKALPWEWVRQVTTRLPSQINHRLVPLWSRHMLD
jgi:predicted AlkP superfamily phosphohydrolase/phosphomutase